MDDLHASIYFSLLILLAGDIQLNPGPHTLATLYNQSGNCSFELSGREIGVDSLVDGSAGASDSRDEELGLRFADRILLRDCVAQVDCERLGPEAGALVEGFRCRQVGPDPAGLMDGGSGVPFGSGVLSAGDVVERSRDGLVCCVDSVALQRGVPDGSAGNPDCSCVFRGTGLGVKMTGTVAAVP